MTRSLFKKHAPDTRVRAEHWGDSAACKGYNAQENGEIFFPSSYTGVDLLTVQIAKAFCQGCPVRGECLDHALTSRIPHGVWGGLTPDERGELSAGRQGRPSAAA